MPNIKSQEKRDRQNIKRRTRNRFLKARIKTDQKNLAEAVDKNLDKAAKNRAVHKNFSANKKSKAAKLVNSIKKS